MPGNLQLPCQLCTVLVCYQEGWQVPGRLPACFQEEVPGREDTVQEPTQLRQRPRLGLQLVLAAVAQPLLGREMFTKRLEFPFIRRIDSL